MFSWSASGLLQATIVANVLKHICYYGSKDDYTRSFSVGLNDSIGAMVYSMFTHGSDLHLFFNMIQLSFIGPAVFINTRSEHWKSPWAFLLVYFGSGLASFFGVYFVAKLLQAQWDHRLQSSQCWDTTIGSDEPDWLVNKDTLLDDQLVDDILTAFFFSIYKYARRVGASGAVWGVSGARMYTAFFNSSNHAPLNENDIYTLVGGFCIDLLDASWHLDTLASNFGLVDHVAHVFGCVSGFVCAALWHRWGPLWTSLVAKDVELDEFLREHGLILETTPSQDPQASKQDDNMTKPAEQDSFLLEQDGPFQAADEIPTLGEE